MSDNVVAKFYAQGSAPNVRVTVQAKGWLACSAPAHKGLCEHVKAVRAFCTGEASKIPHAKLYEAILPLCKTPGAKKAAEATLAKIAEVLANGFKGTSAQSAEIPGLKAAPHVAPVAKVAAPAPVVTPANPAPAAQAAETDRFALIEIDPEDAAAYEADKAAHAPVLHYGCALPPEMLPKYEPTPAPTRWSLIELD